MVGNAPTLVAIGELAMSEDRSHSMALDFRGLYRGQCS